MKSINSLFEQWFQSELGLDGSLGPPAAVSSLWGFKLLDEAIHGDLASATTSKENIRAFCLGLLASYLSIVKMETSPVHSNSYPDAGISGLNLSSMQTSHKAPSTHVNVGLP